jgi:hypothetical protein
MYSTLAPGSSFRTCSTALQGEAAANVNSLAHASWRTAARSFCIEDVQLANQPKWPIKSPLSRWDVQRAAWGGNKLGSKSSLFAALLHMGRHDDVGAVLAQPLAGDKAHARVAACGHGTAMHVAHPPC